MATEDFATAKSSNTSKIPVIDVSGTVTGSDIEGGATAIYQAATTHGFFYISGHGIDQRLLDQAFTVSKAFFAQPTSKKESVAVNTHQRGWMSQGMSHLPGAKTHDLKEVFFWGTETKPDDPDIQAGKPLVAVNQWPTEAFPRLKAELLPYYDALCTVARSIMAAIAVSLDQPAEYFNACYKTPLARGQLVYYPPSTAAHEAEGRFGVAPHTDFGVLTLLLQDNSGGLQVQNKFGDWIEAVVNRSESARYSIPVFFDPHTDTIIDPTDLGVSKKDSQYKPVKAGEHISSRNRQSFSQYKSDRA